mgnify:CR=1 FL=1
MSGTIKPIAALLGVMLVPLVTEDVQAQNVNADAAAAQTDGIQEVVVTGYRASAQAAVRAKKNAEVVLDAISQDDIGRLPDLNIVETARRITGLSTVGGLDPTKSRDIYQRVTIRGLDPRYNLITVDGAPLASSEWTVRGARLEQFPNSLVSRIEAIKTVTAQFDPHALGGQLNIVSRSAFDTRKSVFFAANASVGENSTSGSFLNDKKRNIRADATGSIVFGERDQFGLTVSAEYQQLWSAVNSELPGDTNGNGWTYYTASGSQTPFASLSRDNTLVAVRPQDFRFDNQRSRFSFNSKFEYRPNATDSFSLFAGYYEDTDEEFRAEILTSPNGNPTNVTQNSGRVPTGNLQQGIVKQPQERKTVLLTAKGDMQLSDSLDANFVASYSNATYDEQRVFQKWASTVAPGRASSTATANFGYSYIIQDGAPVATHNAANLGVDPKNYQVLYVRDVRRDADSHVAFLSGELEYNANKDDRGFGARFGGSYTKTLQKFGVGYSELTAANAAAQAQIGGLQNFIFDRRFSSRDHAIVPYLVINPDAVLAFVAANPALFVATDQRANNFADDFRVVEQLTGLYAQGLYRTDRLNIVAGLRFDQAKVDAQTYQVPTVTGSTAYERVNRKNDYSYILPSVLATYQLTDTMRLTGGISKTIGRPDFNQYAARTTYSIGTIPGTLTINTGNPGLKPREATNYDLSFEWYLPRGGLFSAAAFRKDIANEIFTARQQGPSTTYLGTTYNDVTLNTPLNSAKGYVQGLELAYSQDNFVFLPEWAKGFGVNTNLTLLDGSFDLPVSAGGQAQGQGAVRKTSGLIQQPDYIMNATLFYASGPFEARVSYNKIGRALQQANQDTPERDLYQEPRDQIDLQARWSFNDRLDVVFQGQNITEEAFEVRQGPGRAYLNNLFPVGSVYWAGVSVRF